MHKHRRVCVPSLESITIPESVTSIGDSAFSGCTALTEINYNATVANDLSSDNNVFNNAGKNGTGITVNIGANVIKIPAYLFYHYSSYDHNNSYSYLPKITSVVFEEGSQCISIGDYAFRRCTSLNAVYITDIAAWCNIEFDYYYSNPLYYANNLYLNGELVTELVIPDTVTEIKDYAFSGCSGLTSITIPSSVTSIGDCAFEGCSGLISIIVKSGNAKYHSVENCLIETGSKTLLLGCNNSVIPTDGSVTSIGNYAFYNCTSLESIEIPSNVTSIGDFAFYYCTGLTSITIPESVTKIGDGAFYYCTGLTSITILESVTKIGDGAFAYCKGLTSITIPESVTKIGDGAFAYCKGLTSITFEDISTWYRTTDSSYTGGTQTSVADSLTNAVYFADIYDEYYWYKE